jgi:transcriptional regulator with XRE-family HTH domain
MGLELRATRMGVAERIRMALEQTGLQQKDVAAKAGIAPSSLSRLMTAADPDPRISTLAPLARFLRVSLDSLVYDDEAAPESPLTPYDTNERYRAIIDWVESLPRTEREVVLAFLEMVMARTAASVFVQSSADMAGEARRVVETMLRLPEAHQRRVVEDLAGEGLFESLRLRRVHSAPEEK